VEKKRRGRSGQSKKTGPLSVRHSPDVAMKLSTILTNLTRVSGERRPGNSTPALKLPVGAGGKGKVGGTYLRPMDSNAAVGVCDRATGKSKFW